MVDRQALQELLDTHFEWLAVRENGRSLALRLDEIELTTFGERIVISFFDEDGFRPFRIDGFETDGDEVELRISSQTAGTRESVRLVPRQPAAVLAAHIEIARLQKANETADILKSSFAGLRPVRVSLNTSNGRIAEINFKEPTGRHIAVISDITATLTHESLLATAIGRLDKLQARKREPIREMWIAGERRQARNLQKLLAAMNAGTRNGIRAVEIDRSGEVPRAAMLRQRTLSDLWREKPAKLNIPAPFELSDSARSIMEHSPEKIDVIFSRHGETLRFRGLPFARVRKLMGEERTWFGLDRDRRPLNDASREQFHALLDDLHRHRDPSPPAARHHLFRLGSEAWLESILRRNIKLLDPNLILSPIYNQFRASADKIDLLAIRRDGRLVIIEIKTAPDRNLVFQAADYWRKIELQRRRGVLAKARLFGDMEIADRPTLIYAVAPALSFHFDFERHAGSLAREIELWRWELHEDWRNRIKVIRRQNLADV
ncbi:MAG: hypothetical protein QUS14_05535 [Pyrinomonadaceae bacterium]|nr:hypothetical protein [Pyrinomonadaceae bacterium]